MLLKAWGKFSKKHEAQLVIMGDREERKNLEALANKLDIEESVSFRGHVEGARSHLHDFNIFVMPSRSENLPYAVLEAGIAGLPTIATKVGGIPEIIETGINGALVTPENSEELLSTLILLSDDGALRKRLGDKLRETVLNNFSLQKMVANTLKVYL